MGARFEVTWTDEVEAPPEAVWDAITRHADGWLWPVSYEPRVGGAESGLSQDGGTVTEWEPPRRFATRAEQPDGPNVLTYVLTPTATGTRVDYTHVGHVAEDELAVQHEACIAHTDLYRHSMLAYAARFAGRDATYVAVDAPEGTTARLLDEIGLADARVGDEVTVTAPGADPVTAVVDYREGTMVGWRSADGLHRIYGRERWGWPVGIAHHTFESEAV